MNYYKSYEELSTFNTYEERLKYLQTHSKVGDSTFGSKRYVNQQLYKKSIEWELARRQVIIRDSDGYNVLDLGIPGRYIVGSVYVHHINPITENDILSHSPVLYDPRYLICCSRETHERIHYGIDSNEEEYIPRRPNDTCPWKH